MNQDSNVEGFKVKVLEKGIPEGADTYNGKPVYRPSIVSGEGNVIGIESSKEKLRLDAIANVLGLSGELDIDFRDGSYTHPTEASYALLYINAMRGVLDKFEDDDPDSDPASISDRDLDMYLAYKRTEVLAQLHPDMFDESSEARIDAELNDSASGLLSMLTDDLIASGELKPFDPINSNGPEPAGTPVTDSLAA